MKVKALVVSVALALGSASSFATNDGDLDELESKGDLDITITVDDLVQITDLDDIALGTYAGDGLDMSGEDEVCVYRNGTGDYNITFTTGLGIDGAAGHTAYELQSGANTIPYTVDYEDSTAGAYADTAIAHGTALTGQSGHATSVSCASGVNAKVQVNVAAVDIEAAPPGTYAGTLYLCVAPE